jgi:hypothetical protein
MRFLLTGALSVVLLKALHLIFKSAQLLLVLSVAVVEPLQELVL